MHTAGMVFVAALGITLGLVVVFIRLAQRWRFYTLPNERTIHSKPVPPVGGLAFSVGAFLSISLCALSSVLSLWPIWVSLAILVLVGWLDDWQHLSPKQKLFGQLVAAGLMVVWGDVRLCHFEGIFGLGALPETASISLSVFGVVAIINAFNLIDGADGLAGSLALWVCMAFGLWMYEVGQMDLALLAAGIAGALTAFLYFNIAPARVFMGDAGSMFVGAAAAVLAFAFVEGNRQLPETHEWHISTGPALATAVLFVPLSDAVRVFVLRLKQGRSPFFADTSHVHHILLRKGWTPSQISVGLVLFSAMVTSTVWFFQAWGNAALLLLQGAIAVAISAKLERL